MRDSIQISQGNALHSNLLEFDFYKRKLIVIDVDDVMGYSGEAGVRPACGQLNIPNAGRLDQSEFSRRQRYDNIVMPMNVIARVCTREKSPLGDDNSVVFNLKCGDGFHGYLAAR